MVNKCADCLVLKIEEYIDEEIDTTLFILYDKNEECYLVRGRRSEVSGKPSPVSYSFQCECASELIDFISFVICKKSKINYTLYNYDDLPNDPVEIDYDYLYFKELDGHSGYELAGYDNKKFKKKEILQHLRMLRNVFNYY
jgi:hypothetical protein